jgi:D-citramalate synthase
MGERAGNTRLAELVSALHDQTPHRTNVDESRLAAVSHLVETFSGKDVAPNAPIVGRDVFTQTAGVHADGDAKGNLYASALAPERFGRKRRYALGKLAGGASLGRNLDALGIELSAEAKGLVLQRIKELGDKKHVVMADDLPYIIADVLKTPAAQSLRIASYQVVVGSDSTPTAQVEVHCGRRRAKASASGDGGYDALMNALKKAVRAFGIEIPQLEDFRVRIPPGGRTGALVETLITWRGNAREGNFSTLGVDTDQLAAAVIATEKMLNAVAAPRGRARP